MNIVDRMMVRFAFVMTIVGITLAIRGCYMRHP